MLSTAHTRFIAEGAAKFCPPIFSFSKLLYFANFVFYYQRKFFKITEDKHFIFYSKSVNSDISVFTIFVLLPTVNQSAICEKNRVNSRSS